MVAYLGLPEALSRRGLVVELVPGWETRSAGSFNPKGAVCHWTAGPANSKTRPSLNICVNGRSDLPGPLCNVYLDRNGVAVVVAASRANHAGAGIWRGVTGNSSFFGTEAEAAGPADFTPAQRAAYPKVNAAYCDLGKFGADMVCGHSEYALPAGRKVDVNNYPMTEMRAKVAAILAGTLQEDDMPLNAADLAAVRDAVWQAPFDDGVTGKKTQAWQMYRDIQSRVGSLGSQNQALTSTVNALTSLVAKQNGLTLADVRQVVSEEIAKGVDVDVSVATKTA